MAIRWLHVVFLLLVSCVSCGPRHLTFGTEPRLTVIDCEAKATITVDADLTVQLSSPEETLYSKMTMEELGELDQILASDKFASASKTSGTRLKPNGLRCVSFDGVILESSYVPRAFQIDPQDMEAVPAVVREALEFSSEIRHRLFGSD